MLHQSRCGNFDALALERDNVPHLHGTGVRQVTEGDVPACFPDWSPDGRYLAFVRGEPLAAKHPNGDVWWLEVEPEETSPPKQWLKTKSAWHAR